MQAVKQHEPVTLLILLPESYAPLMACTPNPP